MTKYTFDDVLNIKSLVGTNVLRAESNRQTLLSPRHFYKFIYNFLQYTIGLDGSNYSVIKLHV